MPKAQIGAKSYEHPPMPVTRVGTLKSKQWLTIVIIFCKKYNWTWLSIQSLVKTILWFIQLDPHLSVFGLFPFSFFWDMISVYCSVPLPEPPDCWGDRCATAPDFHFLSYSNVPSLSVACLCVCMIITFNFCQHNCDSSSKKWDS